MSIDGLKKVLEKTLRIKIDEHERYPFVTFQKVDADHQAGEFECVMLVKEEKAEEWTRIMIAFEKMQDELGELQEQFHTGIQEKFNEKEKE